MQQKKDLLSVLAELSRLDGHMDPYGPEALNLTHVLLTWVTRANVDNIC
jgi:hypothetical protein